MNKSLLKIDTVFSLISLLSLLYIRHYENALYYRPVNNIPDIVYTYIAVPSFYYFIAACITTVFINLFKIKIPNLIQKIFMYTVVLILVLYVVFVFSRLIGGAPIPLFGFVSIYSVAFAVLGCFFALTIKN